MSISRGFGMIIRSVLPYDNWVSRSDGLRIGNVGMGFGRGFAVWGGNGGMELRLACCGGG